MNVADWTAASPATALASLERHLRCLACNGPVEKALMVLGSLRCLACRDADAPLDPTLFGEMLPEDNRFRDGSPELASE
jgi:hypothetical protein